MKYNVWLLTDSGKPAPAGPSPIQASDLVSAQRLAESTLAELQANHALTGWSVLTVTEAD